MRLVTVSVAAAAALGYSVFAWAGPLTWANKLVGDLSSPTASADCFYFQLVGVPNADGGSFSPWFAVPRTHIGFKEIVALITTAKLTERNVTVLTTASYACSFPVVDYVMVS